MCGLLLADNAQTWADLAGLDAVKQQISDALLYPLAHKELYSQFGVDLPRGILISGPPGECFIPSLRRPY